MAEKIVMLYGAAYWEAVLKTAKKVMTWPDWKRGKEDLLKAKEAPHA